MVFTAANETCMPYCYIGRTDVNLGDVNLLKTFVHSIFDIEDLHLIIKKNLEMADEKIDKIHLKVGDNGKSIIDLFIDYDEFMEILNSYK